MRSQPQRKRGFTMLWVDVHWGDLIDMEKGDPQPTGFTYGFPKEGTKLDLQRLRRIDRAHATLTLSHLVMGAYPQLMGKSDHKAILVEFEPPSFDNEGLHSRFYCPEDIL